MVLYLTKQMGSQLWQQQVVLVESTRDVRSSIGSILNIDNPNSKITTFSSFFYLSHCRRDISRSYSSQTFHEKNSNIMNTTLRIVE